MKNKSIPILICIFTVAIVIASALYINSLRGYLSDCRFECNSLQAKVYRLEELSDVVGILYQILPPKTWAWLKVAEEMRKNEKYKAYEGIEMPLLTEKERKK